MLTLCASKDTLFVKNSVGFDAVQLGEHTVDLTGHQLHDVKFHQHFNDGKYVQIHATKLTEVIWTFISGYICMKLLTFSEILTLGHRSQVRSQAQPAL